MKSDLEDLQITSEELEDLFYLNSSTALAVDVYRALFLKNREKFLLAILNEFLLIILTLTFVVPIGIIVLSHKESTKERDSISALLITSGISLVVILASNLYFWQKVKQVKELAQLIEQIDKYNAVIKDLKMLQRLELVGNSSLKKNDFDYQKVIEALKITKDSLVAAVKIEEIMRKHKNLIAKRHELLTKLENNLVSLLSFEPDQQASEYEHILQEALQIGISVHNEVKKMQNSFLS